MSFYNAKSGVVHSYFNVMHPAFDTSQFPLVMHHHLVTHCCPSKRLFVL